MSKFKPCPFCGSTNIDMIEDTPYLLYVVEVYCEDCDACARESITWAEFDSEPTERQKDFLSQVATIKWNSREKPKKVKPHERYCGDCKYRCGDEHYMGVECMHPTFQKVSKEILEPLWDGHKPPTIFRRVNGKACNYYERRAEDKTQKEDE